MSEFGLFVIMTLTEIVQSKPTCDEHLERTPPDPPVWVHVGSIDRMDVL